MQTLPEDAQSEVVGVHGAERFLNCAQPNTLPAIIGNDYRASITATSRRQGRPDAWTALPKMS
jgi:hypothetical protein